MKKNTFAVLIFFLAVFIAAPGEVQAANEVTFPQSTTWSVNGVSLTISAGDQVDSFTIVSTNASVTLSSGGKLHVAVPNNRTTFDNGASSWVVCNDSFAIEAGGSQTWTITPSATTCTGGGGSSGGGGGGGGGSSTPSPSVSAPSPLPSAVQAPAAPLVSDFSGEAKFVAGQLGTVTIPASLKAVIDKIRDRKASASVANQVNAFVVTGTQSTLQLGAGERAAVVGSFQSAFGRTPATQGDWEDVVKIGNGRWPTQRAATKEKQAEASFRLIYKRTANRKNPNDDAAVTVMAYGLRPANRNTKSEAAALKTFKKIYGRLPRNSSDWDINRAIAYSGAKQ